MQGPFTFHNLTKLYFGDESLNYLKDESTHFGPVVLMNYGSGSMKRNLNSKPEDITEILKLSM